MPEPFYTNPAHGNATPARQIGEITIIARAEIDGKEHRVMLLGIPARPFSARAGASMATAH